MGTKTIICFIKAQADIFSTSFCEQFNLESHTQGTSEQIYVRIFTVAIFSGLR